MDDPASAQEYMPFAARVTERLARLRRLLAQPVVSSPAVVEDELRAICDDAALASVNEVLRLAREAGEGAATEAGPPDRGAAWRARLLVAVGRIETTVLELAHPPSPASSARVSALKEKFRAQFVASSIQRHAQVVGLLAVTCPTNLALIARELHALGGEAAMLGASDVAILARLGEDAAKRADVPLLQHAADQLEIAIFAEDAPRP